MPASTIPHAQSFRAPVIIQRIVVVHARPTVVYPEPAPRFESSLFGIGMQSHSASASTAAPGYFDPAPYGGKIGIENAPAWNWTPSTPQQLAQEINAQRAAPPTQIEFRYYCPDTRAYHPEVAHCASDWLKVLTNLPGR